MRSWKQTATRLLAQRGQLEILAVVDLALACKPVKRDRLLFGGDLFRLASQERDGLSICQCPTFRACGQEAAGPVTERRVGQGAYKVLVEEGGPMGLVNLVRTAERKRYIDGRTAATDYWFYLRVVHGLLEREGDHLRLFRAEGNLKLSVLSDTASSNAVQPALGNSDPPNGRPLDDIHEVHLQTILAANPAQIESGLTLISRGYRAGKVGYNDLLCKDRRGDLVVIEIKSRKADNSGVVEQAARYMGWIKRHLARPNQRIRGMIVVWNPDQKLEYACTSGANRPLAQDGTAANARFFTDGRKSNSSGADVEKDAVYEEIRRCTQPVAADQSPVPVRVVRRVQSSAV